VSGRFTDEDKGAWKISRRRQGCLEGYQTRTRVSVGLTDGDNGVWKVNRRGQGCLKG
jgi:hypothetical protein